MLVAASTVLTGVLVCYSAKYIDAQLESVFVACCYPWQAFHVFKLFILGRDL